MQVLRVLHRSVEWPAVHRPQAHRAHLVLQTVYVEKDDLQDWDGRTGVDRRRHLDGIEQIDHEHGGKIMGDSCAEWVGSASMGSDGVQSGSYEVLRQFLLGVPS